MLRSDQIDDYLSLKYEFSDTECKGPGKLDDNPLLGKVIRAAIGMANRQNGGIVIIGMAENNDHTLYPCGLTDEQLATWTPDLLADKLNAYTSPAISFEYQPYKWDKNNRWFIFLHISEFTDVPIICKKDYKDNSNTNVSEKQRDKILKQGGLYARSLNKAETKEITTVDTLRDLLDRATAKGVRKFMRLAEAANVSVSQRQRDEELFQQQQCWGGKLVEKIVSRGHWRFILRPQQFEAERLEFSQMITLVGQLALSLRYLFPRNWEPDPPGDDWIGQEIQIGSRLEAWRLYQSGQFVLYLSLWDDWEDLLPHSPKPDGWQPGTQLSIEETIVFLTEIFEFAVQLANAVPYHLQGDLHIDIAVYGTKDRALQYDLPPRFGPILRGHVTNAEKILYSENFRKEQLLIAQARELSLAPAIKIFERFFWNPSPKFIQGIQATLFR